MAINEQIKEITFKLKEETTAKETKLKRVVVKNEQTGFYEAQFPIEIDIEKVTYELDQDQNKIGIFEHENLGNVSLTPEEIYSLWSTIVFLDGAQISLGELVAGKIDQIIAAKLQ